MSSVYYVQEFARLARVGFVYVEKEIFKGAGYFPFTIHKISGGTRIVVGFLETVISVALAILINAFSNDSQLKKEGWKLLDFSIHGVGNMLRGFVECHAWIHLVCPLYDSFVPENARLSYSRPIFKG